MQHAAWRRHAAWQRAVWRTADELLPDQSRAYTYESVSLRHLPQDSANSFAKPAPILQTLLGTYPRLPLVNSFQHDPLSGSGTAEAGASPLSDHFQMFAADLRA